MIPDASMRPRPIGLGIPSDTFVTQVLGDASMRPRPIGLGIRIHWRSSRQSFSLQ